MIKTYNYNESLSGQSVFSSLYGNVVDKSTSNLIESYREDNGKLSVKQNRKEYNTAMKNFDLAALRQLSKSYDRSSLIYSRLVDYFSNLLCYYWMVTPKIRKASDLNNEKLLDSWWDCIDYLEIINPEKLFPIIAREVFINGACYIAVREKTKKSTSFGIQFLPNEYCRVRKNYLGRDVIDFNVAFFDSAFKSLDKKQEALNSYPPCITEEYFKYKRLKNKTSDSKWATIDPNYAFRFSLRPDGMPYLISLILDILDVQDIKDITMFKFEQELSKLVVQKFGTNSEGQPIVDLNDLQKFHTDACNMLRGIPAVDVLTTYADVDSVDLQNSQTESSVNPVEYVVQNIYDSAGVSKLLFNADNSGTLKQSSLPDETLMFYLLKQFKEFLQVRIDVNFKKGEGKKFNFSVMMPEITSNNKFDVAKLYKEQVSLGYSKFLPAIALGQRQSEIMSMFIFENDILDLVSMMRPPVSSNNMSSATQTNESEDSKPGAKEKQVDEISEKTAANKETI